MCELENAPEMQKCPKTFEHDCTVVPCPWAIVCLLLSTSRGRNLRGGGSKISFLDTCVHLAGNAKTRIAAYRKPTHTDQYLHFASSHHLEYKRLRFATFIRQPVRKSSSESKWVVSRQLMVVNSGYWLIGQLSRNVIGSLSVKPWCFWLWRLVMSLVLFDPRIVTVRQSFIVSQIVSCPVIIS